MNVFLVILAGMVPLVFGVFFWLLISWVGQT